MCWTHLHSEIKWFNCNVSYKATRGQQHIMLQFIKFGCKVEHEIRAVELIVLKAIVSEKCL